MIFDKKYKNESGNIFWVWSRIDVYNIVVARALGNTCQLQYDMMTPYQFIYSIDYF